jgi:exopolysaccharide biosynthesis polyprenyl glycosylphosphotransferase
LVALLVIADLSVFVVALRIAQWTIMSSNLPDWANGPVPHLALNLSLWLPIAFMILLARGHYRFRYRDGLYSVTRSGVSVLLAGVVYSVVVFFFGLPISRAFVALVIVFSLALLCAFRFTFRVMASRLPPLSRRVMVVGTGAGAESTARMVAQYSRRGLYLVTPEPQTARERDTPDGRAHDAHPLASSDLRRIAAYISALDVDDVVITREWYAQYCATVERVYSMLNHLPAQVHVAPDPAELMTHMSIQDFGGLPLMSLAVLSPSRWQLVIKRVADVVVSVLLLALLSPVLLLVAIVIRRTSPGPAIFRQQRVGQYHRLFTIYKFRSMYGDSASPAVEGEAHKRPGDPRVTTVGRLLRRTSLDELPQLFNVLKGDMSLVGPRPELPEIAANYSPWQYGRLLMPQGITGWWQVNGRGERILHEHTEDDIYYVRNFSLILDARILVMTLRALVTGRGAF